MSSGKGTADTRAPFRDPRTPFCAEGHFRRQDGSTPAEEERSTPSSLPSAKTSRRRLVSDAMLLGAVGAGAILARPLRAAAREEGQAGSASSGDGLALALALPAVGPRTKRIFLARHGEVRRCGVRRCACSVSWHYSVFERSRNAGQLLVFVLAR